MAFNVFVLDYGVMWVGRRQAQNAADAGALAGAVARGYDDFDDPPASDGVAAQSATQVAAANLVWNEAGITGGLVQLSRRRHGQMRSRRRLSQR